MVYSFDIDEKSLFRGVVNDFSRGQSPTVHTPLNQSKDKSKWRTSIYDFLNSCQSKNIAELPNVLIDRCLRKTTSQAESKIVYFYVFSKFSLDGIPFDADSSFAMYVKEETSETIKQRSGEKTRNTHYGRQKLHYPISLNHQSDGFDINNANVLDKILDVNGGFAYVVNGFDVNVNENTGDIILNFRTTMIGLKGVLLSNVFKRKKGVGVKLLLDGNSFERTSLVAPNNKILTNEENEVFFKTLAKIQDSSKANGEIGEKFVVDNIRKIIGHPEIHNIVHVSKKYPQSPYDIEYVINGVKKYIEVKSTSGEKKTFFMSRGERQFMDRYGNDYLLVLITNVKSVHRRHYEYCRDQIMNERIMRQEPQGIKFIVELQK